MKSNYMFENDEKKSISFIFVSLKRKRQKKSHLQVSDEYMLLDEKTVTVFLPKLQINSSTWR